MNLLMIGGDRSILQGKKSAFWYTLQEMKKHWGRIDVLCAKAKHPFCSPESPNCYKPFKEDEIYFHPCPHGLWYQPYWILTRGFKIATSQNTSVMTAHDYPPFYNGIGARWLSKKTSLPYALEIHHIVGHPHSASPTEYIGRLLSRFYFAIDASTATAVRTVNASVKNTLIAWDVPEEKIQVVPSFYLDGAFLSSIEDQPKQYDISFCGRLVENKGIKELIDAVTLLSDVSVVIIGDGPQRPLMEKRAQQNGIADRITFTGWLDTREEVMQTIKSAKMFVMNSKSEGGPRVLLEAMGCGMPVISTPVGIAQSVIRPNENGILTTGTSQNLAVRIKSLLDDQPLQTKLAANARDVLQQFDRSILIKGYADFLKSIV